MSFNYRDLNPENLMHTVKMKNHSSDPVVFACPTGRGGEVEHLNVAPGDEVEIPAGYVGMATRRGLVEVSTEVRDTRRPDFEGAARSRTLPGREPPEAA